jgi:hypothetical protein
LGADIFVVQECEDPERSKDIGYRQFAQNSIWQGTLAYKGLGIFAKPYITLEKVPWNNYLLRSFLPVRVNNDFTLLGVWANEPYIEEYAVYQSVHYDQYDDRMIIIGDFNSNTAWDGKNGRLRDGRSHSDVVKSLEAKNLISAYHEVTGEKQGQETTGTFFLWHHGDKPSHIDYCFVRPDRIKNFAVPDKDDWLKYSDHIPIVLDFD